MKKILLCTLAILIGLPLVMVLIFVAVNWSDEPLLPEVRGALAWAPPAHAFENNGYLIFRGMGAPAGEDAAQFGLKAVESDIESYRTSKTLSDVSDQGEAKRISVLSDLRGIQCVYSEEKNCVDFYLKLDKTRVSQLMVSQKELIDRFIAIQKSEYYVEIAPPVSNIKFPPLQYLTYGSELRRMQAIADISDGNIDEGLSIFLDNALFSRRVLAKSTTLISHMIGLAMVQRDMRILSELIARYPRIASYRERLLPIFTPINTSAYSLAPSLQYERDWQLRVLDDLQDNIDESLKKKEIGDRSTLSKFRDFFFKRNATENLAYKTLSIRIDAIQANAPQLDKAFSDYEIKKKSLMGFSIGGIYFLYNPVGKLLLAVGEPTYITYAERQIDTDGYIRLIAMQMKLIAENVPANKVKPVVLSADKSFRNPYTEEPMEWDAENQELKFQGHVPSNLLPNKSNVYRARLPI